MPAIFVGVITMAKKNYESQGGNYGKPRSVKYNSVLYFNTIHSASTVKGERTVQRLSPTRVRTSSGSQASSPRTSPGLLAGHYAACKFTEPPLPSALPLPPQHWMQVPFSKMCTLPIEKSEHCDLAYQLKVLLNVQA